MRWSEIIGFVREVNEFSPEKAETGGGFLLGEVAQDLIGGRSQSVPDWARKRGYGRKPYPSSQKDAASQKKIRLFGWPRR